jgi:hypothetical protein
MSNLTLVPSRVPNDLLPSTQRLSMMTWQRGNRHGVEVMAKRGGEVRWFGHESEVPPSLSRAVEACETQGIALVRPFALGSPFDAGAWPCIAALLRRCLLSLEANVIETLTPATPEESLLTAGMLARAAAIGEWQGVVHPKRWGDHQVRLLCGYLRGDCGLSELASRIERLPAEEREMESLF